MQFMICTMSFIFHADSFLCSDVETMPDEDQRVCSLFLSVSLKCLSSMHRESQGHTCLGKCTCCYASTEIADQRCCHSQSYYTDSESVSDSAKPVCNTMRLAGYLIEQ